MTKRKTAGMPHEVRATRQSIGLPFAEDIRRECSVPDCEWGAFGSESVCLRHLKSNTTEEIKS